MGLTVTTLELIYMAGLEHFALEVVGDSKIKILINSEKKFSQGQRKGPPSIGEAEGYTEVYRKCHPSNARFEGVFCRVCP